MKPLSSEERHALDVFHSSLGERLDALDGGEGSRLDATLPSLEERGAIIVRPDGVGGVDVWISDLGRLARRVDDAFRGLAKKKEASS